MRRYIDEAIVMQRESAKANGEEPLPTQHEVMTRMAMRSRARMWEFVTFPDLDTQINQETGLPDIRIRSGEILLPGGAVLNIKGALAAGLGPCIKGMEFDKDGVAKIEFADSMAADVTLGKWLNLENTPPPVDEALRESREAMRLLLSRDPEAARQLEGISISVDMMRVTMKRGA